MPTDFLRSLNNIGRPRDFDNSNNPGGNISFDPNKLFNTVTGINTSSPSNIFGGNSKFTDFNPGGIFKGNNIPLSGNTNPVSGGRFSKSFGNFFGTPNNPGFGSQLLGAAGGTANTFLALKQFGLVKDSLKENKKQFRQQFDINKKLTNKQIRERAQARHNVNPNNPTPEEVLKRDGIV